MKGHGGPAKGLSRLGAVGFAKSGRLEQRKLECCVWQRVNSSNCLSFFCVSSAKKALQKGHWALGKGSKGPAKGALGMSLMKPQRKRKKGAGNANPSKRKAFPDVSQTSLDEKLHSYCRSMGIKEAFNMYEYKRLQVQQAESSSSIAKMHRLLGSLLSVSPCGKIKFRNLKQALQSLCLQWGDDLLAQHWPATSGASQLSGRAADAVGVLLNHWRRVSSNETAWARFTSRLDEAQEKTTQELRKKGKQEPAPKRRALAAKVSDTSWSAWIQKGFPR